MSMEWFNIWAKSRNLEIINGVWRSLSFQPSSFVEIYLDVRAKEQRIYSDKQLKNLPSIESSHPLKAEWKIREKSMNNFIKWLRQFHNQQQILEIGCGNGWLSSNIANKTSSKVISQDINLLELEQAARTHDVTKSKWLCLELDKCEFPINSFDQIIFASSVQYFKDPEIILRKLIPTLNKNGCIHIIDSPLYENSNAANLARIRTQSYYESLGNSSLAKNYHHHLLANFISLGFEIKHQPCKRFIAKLICKQMPFYWMELRKN